MRQALVAFRGRTGGGRGVDCSRLAALRVTVRCL